jgi:starvation-inducible outer membrane lipoprotein
MKAKTHPLKKPVENEEFDLETCKQILNVNGNYYSDEEIIRIRNYLYQLVEIQCRHFRQWQAEQNDNVIPIYTHKDERKESIPLYPGEYRRTG